MIMVMVSLCMFYWFFLFLCEEGNIRKLNLVLFNLIGGSNKMSYRFL